MGKMKNGVNEKWGQPPMKNGKMKMKMGSENEKMGSENEKMEKMENGKMGRKWGQKMGSATIYCQI